MIIRIGSAMFMAGGAPSNMDPAVFIHIGPQCRAGADRLDL
jgi:hypothetical protein